MAASISVKGEYVILVSGIWKVDYEFKLNITW